MTQTASQNGADPQSPPLPTHAQGLQRFNEVLDLLAAAGWFKLRVDTYVRAGHTKVGKTVRHHYDHGVWELWFELDRYWWPQQDPAGARRALIRLDRPLPTPREVLSQLFGDQFTTYARVPIPTDRKKEA